MTSATAETSEVNLYSDTQSSPTIAMRRAMASAEVGDEQHFTDPTVTALCERVAQLLGFESAVFLPSGTMCNLIGMRLHVGRGGDEAYMHKDSHPINYESGGIAAFNGTTVFPLEGDKGMFERSTLRAAVTKRSGRYSPRPSVVSIEQTTNIAGGRIWPIEQLGGVVDEAQSLGLRVHLDGARLMNAVVSTGIPAHAWASGCDTAWIDFTKGLGAPLGAVLCGSVPLVDEAWRYKQMVGGALRQAGILAAGCQYALDNHVNRLQEDHENARRLAVGLADIGQVELRPEEVETNIVVFSVPNAREFVARMSRIGVRMGALDEKRVRAVTHIDVDTRGVDYSISSARRVLQDRSG